MDADRLDAPLSLEEISLLIKSMKRHKAPGPDRFPTEFFKRLINKFVPLLCTVYNGYLACGFLPPTLMQASVCLLLKKHKDHSSCTDPCLFLTLMLAARLEMALLEVISQEQNCFIKGCHLLLNVCTLLNVVFCPHSSAVPEVVISLDAEKTFG